jgi:hypothetical protein
MTDDSLSHPRATPAKLIECGIFDEIVVSFGANVISSQAVALVKITSATTMANEEFWSSFGFWMLVVGLVGDVAVLTIPKHRDRLEKVLSAFFTIVIIVGVAIERKADNEISRKTDVKMATLARDAARFEKEAADAGERAAKAEKATEDEKIARLKLEKQIAPRRLPKEQREAVAAALTKFKGRVVRVISLSMDVESDILAAQIIIALRRAGISVEDLRGKFSVMGGSPIGITINGPIGDQDLVKALVDSLSRHGKLLGIRNTGSQPFAAADPTKGVNILVAPKPPSDIEELSKETS